MEAGLLRSGIRQAIAAVRAPAGRRIGITPSWQQPSRFLATPTSDQSQSPSQLDPIRAAPPIDFGKVTEASENDLEEGEGQSETAGLGTDFESMMDRLRIVPRSPSYFTGKPQFTDDLLTLEALARRYQTLPVLPPGEAPRVAWKTLPQYKTSNNEPVKSARYTKILALLQRLNYIQPALMPQEVATALDHFMRDIQPYLNMARPIHVDEFGRARGVGRRKSSHAVVYLVEGEGEVLINGKPLTGAFGRLHDRESVVWALKATDRIDKYNVWGIVKGGGTTGQAEALTLAVSKALMVHEPALKPALRRAGCVTRDPRRVERKKPGKLKARKMPAWVKR